MKLKTCRFEIYTTLDWNYERKCWNFCRFIFFHFESKKGRTITCFFSPPVQRHLRLVANCDDVTIHSTLGGKSISPPGGDGLFRFTVGVQLRLSGERIYKGKGSNFFSEFSEGGPGSVTTTVKENKF